MTTAANNATPATETQSAAVIERAVTGSAFDPTDEQIVMGYEAMRICLGRPTRKYKPMEVLAWMQKQMPSDARARCRKCGYNGGPIGDDLLCGQCLSILQQFPWGIGQPAQVMQNEKGQP